MAGKLNVFWDRRLVGSLWLDPKRQFVFQYQESWANSPNGLPLSKTLPLTSEPFLDDISRPFFINLLPESDVRKLIAGQYGISEKNDFGLLSAIGGDCAGAVSLLPDDQTPELEGDYTPLSEDDLDKMIELMPRKPLLAQQDGLRLSLAGAQNKLPIFIKDGKMFLPTGFNASSHILKPKIVQLEETAENETFCMRLAGTFGLNVPKVHLRVGKHNAYIVDRYDRIVGQDHILHRIHQEDLCQALGYYPDQKYENEGGPTFKACFDLIAQKSVDPLNNKIHLIYLAVFNYLIGNADAHAKNLSVLITKEGIELAPFYDLMSTAVYPDLSTKMAMKIGNQYQRDMVTHRQWTTFAEQTGVKGKFVVDIVKLMCSRLPDLARQEAKRFSNEFGNFQIVEKICEEIEKISRQALTLIKQS